MRSSIYLFCWGVHVISFLFTISWFKFYISPLTLILSPYSSLKLRILIKERKEYKKRFVQASNILLLSAVPSLSCYKCFKYKCNSLGEGWSEVTLEF